MPNTIGRVKVDPGGLSVVVDITGASGVRPSLYTAENGSSLHTMPQTISTPTSYYFVQKGTYSLSALYNGSEIAAGSGTTAPFEIASDTNVVLAVGLDATELPTAINSVNAELGYAESTADFTVASGTSDITGCVITITAGARPIKLIGHSNGFNSSAGGDVELEVWEGAAVHCLAYFKSINASDVGTLHAERRVSLTPGSHTIRLRATRVTALGTSHVYGAGNFGPTFIQAIQQ